MVTLGKDKVVVLDFVTDLQRIAEVVQLEKASAGPTERLPWASISSVFAMNPGAISCLNG
jgi:hypothetical protein